MAGALQRQDPKLGRFDPLPRILVHDDFDRGFCGWTQLVGNYEHSLDSMLPGYSQHTSPMLSTLGHWDAGSHGGVDGSYALKLATRPRAGAQNVSIKRLTFRRRGPIRLEAYFTFKPEASALRLSETDVRAFGFLFDLQVGDRAGAGGERVMPHVRFLNAEGGAHVQKWQFKRQRVPVNPIGTEGKTISHYHLAPEGWEDLAEGQQSLCYNEIPTKVNWHYLCFDFDLETMACTGFRCNDRFFDVSGFDSLRLPAMKNLWCMLNLAFFIETDTDKRSFGYLDGICLSEGV
ncbi:hypothetical protein EMQ25_02190 [Arsenicitalea aurantiaca]|uniref:Uncharacterized protein n=1 Tax=Arsenicitalea aurantiaca TaxID=1783274 RepID=A0A433XM83_9HYPH|nr:hypothetical protein EMQ25_02190 [Arsenicitalea aurantiaca]